MKLQCPFSVGAWTGVAVSVSYIEGRQSEQVCEPHWCENSEIDMVAGLLLENVV